MVSKCLYRTLSILLYIIILNYNSLSSLSISSIQSSLYDIINRNQQRNNIFSKFIPKSVKQIIGHQPSYIYLSIKKLISNFYSIEYEDDYTIKDQKFLSLLLEASKHCARIYDHHQLFLKPNSFTYKDKISNNNLNKTIILSVDKYNYTDCMVVFQAYPKLSQINTMDNNANVSVVDVDIWVVIRGTSTKIDFLLDLSWLLTTKSIGNYHIPVLLSLKVQNVLPKLIKAIHDYTIMNKEHRLKRRIYFTGHSLGGAMATALYLYYQSTIESSQMPGEVFTFGAPLVLASQPSSQWSYQQRTEALQPIVKSLPAFYRIASYLSQATSTNARVRQAANVLSPGLTSFTDTVINQGLYSNDYFDDNNNNHNNIVIDSMTLASRIHNIVNELDPVPRLLGDYPLPSYLPYLSTNNRDINEINLETDVSINANTNTYNSNNINNIFLTKNIISMISQSLHGRIRQIRKYYQPFGKYYLLVADQRQLETPSSSSKLEIIETAIAGNRRNYSKKNEVLLPTTYVLWEDQKILSNEISSTLKSSMTTATNLNTTNNNISNTFITNTLNISTVTNRSTNDTVNSILDFFPVDIQGFINCLVSHHDIKSTVQRLQSLIH